MTTAQLLRDVGKSEERKTDAFRMRIGKMKSCRRINERHAMHLERGAV